MYSCLCGRRHAAYHYASSFINSKDCHDVTVSLLLPPSRPPIWRRVWANSYVKCEKQVAFHEICSGSSRFTQHLDNCRLCRLQRILLPGEERCESQNLLNTKYLVEERLRMQMSL